MTDLSSLFVSQTLPSLSQLSGISTWYPFTIFCSKKPYWYLIPLPWPGIPIEAIESIKQAASLPRPPFPSPASTSVSSNSSKLTLSSAKASLTVSLIPKLIRLLWSSLPIKNSIEK